MILHRFWRFSRDFLLQAPPNPIDAAVDQLRNTPFTMPQPIHVWYGDGDHNPLGLGLFIARKGVEASGGQLQVEDLPGTGCVFTIELPLAS
jgi:hypothetical protein